MAETRPWLIKQLIIKINATISFSLEDFLNSIPRGGLSNQYSGDTRKAPKKALGSHTWSKRCVLQLGLDLIIDKEVAICLACLLSVCVKFICFNHNLTILVFVPIPLEKRWLANRLQLGIAQNHLYSLGKVHWLRLKHVRLFKIQSKFPFKVKYKTCLPWPYVPLALGSVKEFAHSSNTQEG